MAVSFKRDDYLNWWSKLTIESKFEWLITIGLDSFNALTLYWVDERWD